LKKTHKVQSHRGMVERIIRRVKEFASVQGVKIESIEMFEILLDNVCAQHNLKEMMRQGLVHLIPKAAPHAPDAHIFTLDLEPSLKIPRETRQDAPKVPLHLRKFHEELRSIVPRLKPVLAGAGPDACFSTRVLARGRNLFEGANVLQVTVQDEGDGLYTVRFNVGASMKSPVYKCYIQLKKDEGLIRQACECKNG
jgi:hypothetical protein